MKSPYVALFFSGKEKKISLSSEKKAPFVWTGGTTGSLCRFNYQPMQEEVALKAHIKTTKGVLAPLTNGKTIFDKSINFGNHVSEVMDGSNREFQITVPDNEGSALNIAFSMSEPTFNHNIE